MKIVKDEKQDEYIGIDFIEFGEVFALPDNSSYYMKCKFKTDSTLVGQFTIVNLATGYWTYINRGSMVIKVKAELRVKE